MANKTKDPMITTVDGNTTQKIKKGDGIADVLVKSQAKSKKAGSDKAEENKYLLTGQDKYRKPGQERGTRAEGYHPYQKAANIRQSGLGQLAAQRMIEGEGIGASLKGATKDKFKAMKMGMKEKFDPLNIVKKMTFGSKFLTAAAGKMMKRSSKDIEYFSGVKAPTAKKVRGLPEVESAGGATVDGGGKGNKGGMGGNANGILNKIYKVLADSIEENKKERELTKDFEKENKSEEQKDRDHKHKELIDALKGIFGKSKPEDKKKGGGLMGMLGMAAGLIMAKLRGIFGPILKFVTSIGSKILGGLTSMASKIWGGTKDIASKLMQSDIATKAKSVVKSVAGKGSSLVKSGVEAVKGGASSVAKGATGAASKVGGALKNIGKTVAKGAKSAAGAAGKTATKVASSALKGAGKLLKFVKGVPGLGVLAAGVDLIMRMQDLNSQLEAGTLKESDYKKAVAGAVGSAAGGAGGAALLGALGATAGSIVPGVGTLVGGIGGGVLGFMGGEAIGGFLGEKLYDYFVDGKKSASPAGATASKAPGAPTASPASPTTPKAASGTTPSYQTAIKAASAPPATGARLNEASQQSSQLAAPASGPTVINKPTTINNVTHSSGGGSGGSLNMRNDDAVLLRVQYGSVWPV
jgi:hypothetical protein